MINQSMSIFYRGLVVKTTYR